MGERIAGPERQWYVIQAKPKKDLEAQTWLTLKGIEIFSPFMECVMLRGGRLVSSRKPLFPGYLFAHCCLRDDYSLIHWGRGIKKIVSFGAEPLPVADEVIELIRERTEGGTVIRKACSFQPDDMVRVRSGPMKDLIGIFERWVSDSERVRILLNLIGYRPAVELHYSMVERIA